jgi:phosphoribosylanthranilate isomerase
MTRIKICGLTDKETAWAAVESGVDAIGFVFTPSKRKVTPDRAREIIRSMPPYVSITGVFVDTDLAVLNDTAEYCRLDLVQLHGEESPEYCAGSVRPVVKTLKIRSAADLEAMQAYRHAVRAFLLDSYVPGSFGGTGQTFPWEYAEAVQGRAPIILAGGLHAGNVMEAIRRTKPYGVDVSSGVETDGVKDPVKMFEFVQAVRSGEMAS